MKKKLLLLALAGTTTLTSLVITGLSLSNANSFSIAADGGLVEHSLIMTTDNTTVSTEAGYDCDYLNMDTYTSNGNKFGVYEANLKQIIQCTVTRKMLFLRYQKNMTPSI